MMVGKCRFALGVWTVGASLMVSGCVTTSTHQAALDALAKEQQQVAAYADELREVNDLLTETGIMLDAEREAHDVTRAALLAATDQLEQATQRIEQTERELATVSGERDKLQAMLAVHGKERAALMERLKMLQSVEDEIRERNRIFAEVMERLQALLLSHNDQPQTAMKDRTRSLGVVETPVRSSESTATTS